MVAGIEDSVFDSLMVSFPAVMVNYRFPVHLP